MKRMDSVIFVCKKSKGFIRNKYKRNKSYYLIVIVAVREQEDRLKIFARVALNNLNKVIARRVVWNVLTTKRYVTCAMFIM